MISPVSKLNISNADLTRSIVIAQLFAVFEEKEIENL